MRGTKGPDEADVMPGRRLKSLRVRRGLSQTALGKVVGSSFQQIQKFESGAHRMRVSQLWRIAERLATHQAAGGDKSARLCFDALHKTPPAEFGGSRPRNRRATLANRATNHVSRSEIGREHLRWGSLG